MSIYRPEAQDWEIYPVPDFYDVAVAEDNVWYGPGNCEPEHGPEAVWWVLATEHTEDCECYEGNIALCDWEPVPDTDPASGMFYEASVAVEAARGYATAHELA